MPSHFLSLFQPFSPLSDYISTFIWYSQNALRSCATLFALREGYTCWFLQREERKISDSSPLPQKLPAPLGNSSAASLLVRTAPLHANCFVFLTLSTSILSEQKAAWTEKKGSPQFKMQLLKQYEPEVKEEMLATEWWIYDNRVKRLSFPFRGFFFSFFAVGSV